MLTALRLEVFKLIRKPRTYIGPAALAGLTGIILVSMVYGSDFRHIQDRLESEFFLTGSIENAAFMTCMMLELVSFVLLPLFACMVFGDLLASEAADGTLRMMLCRPITRFKVVVSKYIVGAAYTLALTVGMGVFSYLVGLIFLGRGSLVSVNGGIWILPERMAMMRLLLAYGLAAVGMVAIGSMAFAISTLLSNSNGAIVGAMGLVICSTIIGQIQYFDNIKPYLLTTYLHVGQFIVGKPDMALYHKSLYVMAAYAVVSLAVGLVIFSRKDVLS